MYLRHPPVRHSVGGNDIFSGPVPQVPQRAGTPVTAVLGLPEVSLAGRVGRPGAVRRADGVDVRARVAVKPVSPLDLQVVKALSLV